MTYWGLEDRDHFRKTYLRALLEFSKIRMTISKKPKSKVTIQSWLDHSLKGKAFVIANQSALFAKAKMQWCGDLKMIGILDIFCKNMRIYIEVGFPRQCAHWLGMTSRYLSASVFTVTE